MDEFEPPVSMFPNDLKVTLRASNALRTAENQYLAPIIPWHHDKKTLPELSRLIAALSEFAVLREVYDRLSRHGLWCHIRAIRNVYRGTGAYGFFCGVVDHEAFPRDLTRLSQPHRFCRDIGNIHGPRDSFRENVIWGQGLHVCVTQPAQRATVACDIHIDQYQQGSHCVAGYCIPCVLDPRTVAHVVSVAPWLASDARRAISEALRRRGITLPW